jgi:lambda family phage portal protein
MIGEVLDSLISVFSPMSGLRRAQSRRLLRSYAGAESSRLTANKKPRNQSADGELLGPHGADAMRAWARALVRDNAYAWGVVDTIVSSVVGLGISAQSMVETPEGEDVEDVNEIRDSAWDDWCEVCDVNGQYGFSEMQQLIQREIVEAGECLIHMVNLSGENYRGINRRVPLALELIEADRIANDRDTYQAGRSGENRIVRGVEIDDLGKPVAYWIYPEHPNSPYVTRNTTPERIPAKDIIHLFRRDRIGQTRGISWFAPVMSWLRDLGVYVDNEIQASAVASCFAAVIKTNSPVGGLGMPSTATDPVDTNGNAFEHLEPGIVARLQPGEDIVSVNPGRPNSASEPWINLMLRGIAVGTGLSYEIVARDYSKTTYSSSRTSQLEDRRRFRRWQKYLIQHLCQPVRDRWTEQAALAGLDGFPTMSDLLDNRRGADVVEWQTPEWEWVDPQNEQAASQGAIDAYQSTYQTELGARGKNWRQVFYQRAKEEKLKRELGLITADMAEVEQIRTEAATTTVEGAAGPSGEMAGLSRLQFQRNRKAIEDILAEFIAGTTSEAKARVFLASIGMTPTNIDALLEDASDGTVDTLAEENTAVARKKKILRNCGIGAGGFQPGNKCQEGGTAGGGSERQKKKAERLQKHDADMSKVRQTHASKTSEAKQAHSAKVAEIQGKVDKQAADLQAEVTAVETQHDAERQELASEHQQVRQELEAKHEQIETELTTKHETVRNEVTSRQTEEMESLDSEHETQRTELDEKHTERAEAASEAEYDSVVEGNEKEFDKLTAKQEKEVDKLNTKHESEMEKLEASQEKELEKVQDKHANQVDRLERVQERKEERLAEKQDNVIYDMQEKVDEQVEKLQQEADGEIELLNDDLADSLQQIDGEMEESLDALADTLDSDLDAIDDEFADAESEEQTADA